MGAWLLLTDSRTIGSAALGRSARAVRRLPRLFAISSRRPLAQRDSFHMLR